MLRETVEAVQARDLLDRVDLLVEIVTEGRGRDLDAEDQYVAPRGLGGGQHRLDRHPVQLLPGPGGRDARRGGWLRTG